MANILQYYGMKTDPFPRNIKDTENRFRSMDFKQGYGALKLAVSEQGIGFICGDIGRGVSYTAHCLKSDLDVSRYVVKYFPVCHICPRDFYKGACRTIGASHSQNGREAMIASIRSEATRIMNQGHTLVLILDNAQNIPDLVFHDLVTIAYNDDSFLSSSHMALLLCGTKDLKYRIALAENNELCQRHVSHYTFRGLSEEEAFEYVRQKLKTAGADDSIISDEALRAAYALSGNGICRELENVMREALILGVQQQRQVIDLAVIRAAAAYRVLDT